MTVMVTTGSRWLWIYWVVLLWIILCTHVGSFGVNTRSFASSVTRFSGYKSNAKAFLPNKLFANNGMGGGGSGEFKGPPDFQESARNNSNDNSNTPLFNKWNTLSTATKEDIKATAFSIIIAVVVRWFVIEPRYIPSLSMFPTFEVGDYVMVNKLSSIFRPYQKRDIIVFNPPEAYVALTGNTEALIKRIIAVAGDAVEIKDHHLYINNIQQQEEYINEMSEYDFPQIIVPPGMLLVLGDNRNYSFDSHDWGFVPIGNVIGKAILRYWPLPRLSFIK